MDMVPRLLRRVMKCAENTMNNATFVMGIVLTMLILFLSVGAHAVEAAEVADVTLQVLEEDDPSGLINEISLPAIDEANGGQGVGDTGKDASDHQQSIAEEAEDTHNEVEDDIGDTQDEIDDSVEEAEEELKDSTEDESDP